LRTRSRLMPPTDRRLTQLAESGINVEAAVAVGV
jgi:hypothetical protein